MNNNNLTYRELLEKLSELSEEDLNKPVMMHCTVPESCWFAVTDIDFVSEDVLQADGILEVYNPCLNATERT